MLPAIIDEQQPLTVEEDLFIDVYIEQGYNLNKVGEFLFPGEKNNRRMALEMFRRPHVHAALEDRLNVTLHNKGYNKEETIEHWLKVAKSDIGDYIQWRSFSDPTTGESKTIVKVADSKTIDTSCIKTVKVDRNGTLTFEMYDKVQALKQIGDMLGLHQKQTFAQVEITGKDGGPIQVEDVKSKMLERLNKINTTYSIVAEEVEEIPQNEVPQDI